MLGKSQSVVAIRHADLRMRRPRLHGKSGRGGKHRTYDDATPHVGISYEAPLVGGLLSSPQQEGSMGRRHWLRRAPITNSLCASTYAARGLARATQCCPSAGIESFSPQ